jgi:hypothetical protein
MNEVSKTWLKDEIENYNTWENAAIDRVAKAEEELIKARKNLIAAKEELAAAKEDLKGVRCGRDELNWELEHLAAT